MLLDSLKLFLQGEKSSTSSESSLEVSDFKSQSVLLFLESFFESVLFKELDLLSLLVLLLFVFVLPSFLIILLSDMSIAHSIPLSLLISPRGKIEYRHAGVIDVDDMRKRIAAMLPDKRS